MKKHGEVDRDMWHPKNEIWDRMGTSEFNQDLNV